MSVCWKSGEADRTTMGALRSHGTWAMLWAQLGCGSTSQRPRGLYEGSIDSEPAMEALPAADMPEQALSPQMRGRLGAGARGTVA